jgi:WD40 repeat protein
MKGRRTSSSPARPRVRGRSLTLLIPLILLTWASPAAAQPRLVVEKGHKGLVAALAFTPDGRQLVSASKDGYGNGEIKVWDVATGLELRTISSPGHGVSSLALDSRGRTLATGGGDNAIRVWNLATGQELRRLEGHSGEVTALAFSASGTLASVALDDTIRVWDAAERGRGMLASKDGGWQATLAFRPDGKSLVAATRAGRIKVWDPGSGAETDGSDTGAGQEIASATFSEDGTRLVVFADVDAEESSSPLRVWPVESAAREWVATSSATVPFSGRLVLSRDGRLLATPGEASTVMLWEVGTSKAARIIATAGDSPVTSLAFSADSKALALGRRDGTLDLVEVSSGESVRRMGRAARTIDGLTISSDGRRLAYGTQDRPTDVMAGEGAADRRVKVWDLVRGHPMRTPAGDVLLARFGPDAARLATGDRDGSIKLLDLLSGSPPVTLSRAHLETVSSLSFTRDGLRLASGGWDGRIRLWDLETVSPLYTFDGDARWVPAVDFSPDGRLLAGVFGGSRTDISKGVIAFWDLQTGREVRRLTGSWGQVYAMSFSPDGALLATGSEDGVVRLWSASTGEVSRTLEDPQHRSAVVSVAFSPDGAVLASGDFEGTVALWDVATGAKRLRASSATSGIVNDVVFFPDGNFLAASIDNTVHLWRADTGKEVASLIALESTEAGGGEEPDLEWVVVTPDGLFDASAGGMDHLLHWVVDREPIAVGQLKERYYEPGLLAKILGLNPEPLRDVRAFAAPSLYPQIELREPDRQHPTLGIRLRDRGGGIGRVVVSINGKEVTADARGPKPDRSARVVQLEQDVAGHPFLKPGQNVIEVRAYNAEGYLVSRGARVVYEPTAPVPSSQPRLWAIVSGVSNYDGEAIDLRFAAKDAVDMAQALKLGADRLFDGRVEVKLLTTEPVAGAAAPTKENLVAALKDVARQARATDVLVVFLAGHGVTHGGAEGDFYYLTRTARSADLTDPAVRSTSTLSSLELTELTREVPALQQVLILDTCGAGGALERLSAHRDVPSSQIRALERMKDRTGVFILAGAAADAVSYETSRYGQGLLTYSLLLGMRGAALREDEFVDVGILFDSAVERVPELARDIGGIQRPLKATPGAEYGSFYIGQLSAEDRARIPLASPRPMVLRASFQDEDRFVDSIGLTRRVNDELRALAAEGAAASFGFVDVSDFPDAHVVAGRYRLHADAVTVTFGISKGERDLGRFTVEGDRNRPAELARLVLAELKKILVSP